MWRPDVRSFPDACVHGRLFEPAIDVLGERAKTALEHNTRALEPCEGSAHGRAHATEITDFASILEQSTFHADLLAVTGESIANGQRIADLNQKNSPFFGRDSLVIAHHENPVFLGNLLDQFGLSLR